MSTYFKASEVSSEIRRRLEAITVAGGCETDIGALVLMGSRKIDDERAPFIQVLEGLDDVSDQAGRDFSSVVVEQQYVVSAFLPCDPDHPNLAAHAAIRDIKRAIFAGGASWGGRVKVVRYKGRDIGPREDGVALVQAAVLIEVVYVENLQDP